MADDESKMRMVFPCGAFYPIREWPIDGAHYAKDGAIQFCVYPGTAPFLGEKTPALVEKKYHFTYDQNHAPCHFFCPTPKRRKEEMRFSLTGEIGTYVSCYGRLHERVDEGWKDTTPAAPKECPHCAEQRTYVAACKRAAKKGWPGRPVREMWRLCPQCQRHDEVTVDTGLCRACQSKTFAQCQHVFDGPNAEEPETGLVTRTCSKCGKWQK